MKLFLLLLFWCTSTEGLANTTNDINIRIGAGYGVGLDDGIRLPKSTSKVLHSTTNTLSEILSREAQHRRPKNVIEPEFAESTQHVKIDPHTTGHNMGDIQSIVDGLEHKYSKIVQVVKVPAVYEIHLQTDVKRKSKPEGNQHGRKVQRYTKVRYNRDQRVSSLGKRESSRGSHLEGHFRVGRNPPRTNRILQRKTAPFSHNQQIMDPEHPPQAMYEVPAPSLGDNRQHHWNYTSANTKYVGGSSMSNEQLNWNSKETTPPNLKNHQIDWSQGLGSIDIKNIRDSNLGNHQLEWNQATNNNLNIQQPSWNHPNTNNMRDNDLNKQHHDWNQASTSNHPLNLSAASTDVTNIGNPKLNSQKPVWSSIDTNPHDLSDPNFTNRRVVWNPAGINPTYPTGQNSNNHQPMWSSVDTITNDLRNHIHQPELDPSLSNSNAAKSLNDQPLVWNSVNLYSTLTPAIPYERTMGNKNGNLVYGRAFEPVMAPALLAGDRGIPEPLERRRDNGVDINRVYFTTERSRGGFSDRMSRHNKDIKPVGYSIYTRISERYIDGNDRK